MPPPPPVISPTCPFSAAISGARLVSFRSLRGKPCAVENLADAERTALREGTFREPHPPRCIAAGKRVITVEDFCWIVAQARTFREQLGELKALLGYCSEPTRQTLVRLHQTFQQMREEHGQPVADLAAVAARHPFELLGDVFEV